MFYEHQQLTDYVDNKDNNETRETTEPSLRRSNRTRVPTKDFLQSVSQQHITFEPQTIAFKSYYEEMHEEKYALQDQMTNPNNIPGNR